MKDVVGALWILFNLKMIFPYAMFDHIDEVLVPFTTHWEVRSSTHGYRLASDLTMVCSKTDQLMFN